MKLLFLKSKDGLGVDRNYNKVAELYEQSCDGGNSKGCKYLGFLYAKGLGVDRNVNKAEELYQLACDGGDSESCNFGFLHGNSRSIETSWRFFLQGCAVGNQNSCESLSFLIRKGINVTQASTIAREVFQQRCDNGYIMNCIYLGYLYRKGLGTHKNIRKAGELFKQGCDRGIQSACIQLKKIRSQ